MRLQNSNSENLETRFPVVLANQLAKHFRFIERSASNAWLICLIAASTVLGLSPQALCQVEDLPREQPVFSVPNSANTVIDGATPEKIRLQPAANPSLSFGRGSLEIQSALKTFGDKFSKSTVVIETQHGHKSLGTIISKQGFIVGKHSEINGTKFVCHIGDQKVRGQALAYHQHHDLVLIKVEPQHLTGSQPISFSQSHLNTRVGHMVVSPGSEGSPAKLGVVSVLPQRFNIQQPTLEDGIDLGLAVSQFVVTKKTQVSGGSLIYKGLEIQRVYPRSVSERSGLFVGDLLQRVNGISISSRYDLEKFAKSLRVGQKLSVEVLRDGKPKTLSTRIQSFAPKVQHDRWGGGPFSDRRFGFARVISHDSVIPPEQCGGPLVDLHGNVLGINIARSMRVASFAIPLREVERFVRIVRPGIELAYDQ